ncbi:MAG TPA: PhzF family phenazine biosynthesis protein [Fimbriimonadaceae bacterium]|nr:PhzF family phenazine biosynthesis protein [Fimbriimonadaceae bacterium]
MNRRIYLVDAFSNAPFTGNPAGVCPLDGPADEQWMQSVAMEMNQAETAFFWPEDGAFRLRWFTPTLEVDLCGHATLASAHVMYETGLLAQDATAKFHTKSGELTCKKNGGFIEMDFPNEQPKEIEPFNAESAIGVTPLWNGENRMAKFAVLGSEDEVRSIKPDFGLVSTMGRVGLIVTAKADKTKADFVSRFFAPQAGVPEDPVTGSAHCGLGPYWISVLGKDHVTGYQASKRGGFVQIESKGDRVVLKGEARTTMTGELNG